MFHTVTDINRTKRGRYSIYIDGEFYCVLYVDVYVKSKISVGDKIDIDLLDQLIFDSEIIIAKERALRLLSARSYTKKGLITKLITKVDQEAAEQAAQRMEELGLINDEDYALRYAKDCINLKGYSHRRIATVLYQKGIERETIDKTLLELGEENSQELILKLLRKKYASKIGDEDNRRRTINALMRRGFAYNDVVKIINNLTEDESYYEYD